MPCKCGSIRIVREDVQCPRCDSIRILDPKPRILEIEQKLRELSLRVQQILTKIDPEEMVEALIIERERIAQICLTHPTSKKDEIKRWLAIDFLLSKYPWKGKGIPTQSLSELLVVSSEEILELENDAVRLKKGLTQIIMTDGLEEIVPTELDILSSIPDKILEQYQQDYSLLFKLSENRNGRTMNFELLGIKEILVQPGLPSIVGEKLYRELKSVYQPRILPFISPSNTSIFINISLRIAGLLAFLLGVDFASRQGIMRIDFSKLMHLKSVLVNEFGEQDVKWYFEHVGIPSKAYPPALGSTVIVTTKKGRVFLPYFSIFLLIYLSLRWEKNPEKGEFLQYIGRSFEDVIFSYMNGFAINTEHPIHKKPLLRVPHPEKNEEIADVMGYDDHYLIVIESKFRETPTISSLDVELHKFLGKLHYIKNNLAKFGFCETLEIIPFFCTPFPPYNKWNGIKLIPSLTLLGDEFSHLFGPRPIELSQRSESLQQLLQSIDGPTPYPVDISSFDESIPPNTYRVQDGVIRSYDENEVTVLVNNPIGTPMPLIVDISKDLHAELEMKGVGKGDIIKMALFNLNKAWSQIQLVEFRLANRYETSRDELDDFGLLSILKLHSTKHELERVIHQTWGKELGDEILAVLKKWNIDLAKLIECQINKGQNVLIGVGKMLGLADSFDVLVQCKCGEVMGFNSDFVSIVQTLYPDGNIRCNRCDPMQIGRLQQLGYRVLPIDHSILLEYKLEHLTKD